MRRWSTRCTDRRRRAQGPGGYWTGTFGDLTDPTSGDDEDAIQDIDGDDAATFTLTFNNESSLDRAPPELAPESGQTCAANH